MEHLFSMNFKSFFYVLIGMSLLGLSLGYVLGFYIQKHSSNNFLFYLSVPLFVIASLLIIYGALFLKDNKNE